MGRRFAKFLRSRCRLDNDTQKTHPSYHYSIGRDRQALQWTNALMPIEGSPPLRSIPRCTLLVLGRLVGGQGCMWSVQQGRQRAPGSRNSSLSCKSLDSGLGVWQCRPVKVVTGMARWFGSPADSQAEHSHHITQHITWLLPSFSRRPAHGQFLWLSSTHLSFCSVLFLQTQMRAGGMRLHYFVSTYPGSNFPRERTQEQAAQAMT